MLKSLRIEDLKCFSALDLSLGKLTLLSGVNGGGKSTVIQSLVLLSHTLNSREWGRTLALDGPDIALGSAADVLNQAGSRRSLALGASMEGERIEWRFRAEDRRALSLELDGVIHNEQSLDVEKDLRWLLPIKFAEQSGVVRALRRVSWISAERAGPREILPLPDPHQLFGVGARGQYAAGLLYWRDQDRVCPELRLKDPPTLFQQVRARMQQFFPGCDISVSPIEGANAVSLRLRTNKELEFQRPQNVGFGFTQLFPILVAVLSAEEGDFLMIENPEVHLHPEAQQRIGHFLALAANSGVQVLVETHSDHVLNGVRLAVKRGELAAGDTAFHFFGQGGANGGVSSLSIDADGRLDRWPDGFFDQFDRALSELL